MTSRSCNSDATTSVLFLAQLPPPVHGVTVVSKRVSDILSAQPDTTVEHLWRGGARSLADIGSKSISKVLELTSLAGTLVARALIGPRTDIAYLTFTPWSHAALRDGALAWLAGLSARRVLVHLHTEGLAGVVIGRGLRERALRRLLKGSELIAITEETARLAEGSGIFARVNRLPNMAEDPGEECLMPRAARPDDSPLHCAYLGNYDERKGVLDFISVIAALRDRGIAVRATLAGGETAALSRQDLALEVTRCGLEEVVDLVGFLSQEEKMALMCEADLFIYPTRHDHAPLVLLEAMAGGAVPLTLDAGGISSLMGDELAINVLSHRMARDLVREAMTERAVSYAIDRAALRRDSRRARARYLERFSPAAFEAGVTRIINARPVTSREASGKETAAATSEL